jgi:hypothetical protein|tara:strand:+ start:7718 stop:8803 length:1086 start_codon:yes stop_codon:yes gene_type:complete
MKIPSIITDTSIVIVIDNKPFTIKAGNSNFVAVRDELKKGDKMSVDRLKQLLDVEKAVTAYSNGAVSVKDGVVTHQGSEVNGVVVTRILNFMRDGLDHKPLVAFLDRLLANDSRRAVEELYTFLEHKHMPITPEGHFIAYKGVGADFYSHTGGDASKLLQGTADARGRINNAIGETIEVVRNYVDDNANRGCSAGLHAGSYEYANGFMGSGHLMLVQIDPADVVSVPTDCSCQKLRATKYKVVAEIQPTGPLTDEFTSSYNDDYDSDDSSDDTCENCGDDIYGCECELEDFEDSVAEAVDSAVAEEQAAEAFDTGFQAGYLKAQRAVALSERAKKQKRNKNGSFAKYAARKSRKANAKGKK